MIHRYPRQRSGGIFWLTGILLLIMSVSPASADGRDISGYVLDEETGEAFPYANVLLKGHRQGTFTNVDGHFVLVNVPAEVCTLVVSFIGYEDEEVVVDNSAANRERLVVRLESRAFNQQDITVYGERYETWKTAELVGQMTFSARDVSDLPGFGEMDVFRSLQLLPGVSAVGDGSSGLYIRGGTPDQNLVILDGMTVYHVDHFFGVFSAFNANAIKDIQVYKGGYPARFGGRLASVVELTGKTGDVNEPSFAFGANLLSTNAVLELPLFGHGSWLISFRRSYTDVIRSGLYSDLFGTATGDESASSDPAPEDMGGGGGPFGGGGGMFQQATSVPAYYFYDFNSKITFSPSEKDVLALSVYGGRDNMVETQNQGGMGLRFGDASGSSGTRVYEDITDWGNLGVSFKWSRQWNTRFYTNLLFSGSQYTSEHSTTRDFEFDDDTAIDSTGNLLGRFGSMDTEEENEVNDITARLNTRWNITSNHQIGFGTWVSQVHTRFSTMMMDTMSVLDRDAESVETSFYLEDKWRIADFWELTPGLRATWYERTKSHYWEPRITTRFFLNDNLTLSGAWGHYHQFINRITNEDVLEGSRDFWIIADEELDPGFAEHRIVSLTYENDNYLLEASGYWNSLDNVVEYSRRNRRPGMAADEAFFLGTGTARGIEFLGQKKFGSLTGWAAYTIGRVEYTFPDMNDGNTFPASHDRTHEFKTVWIYKEGPLTLSTTWVLATGRAYTAPESQYFLTLLDGEQQSYIHVSDKNANRLPTYHRLDVSASLGLIEFGFPNWEVGLSVLNLYNRQNVSYRKYDLDVTPVTITDVTMLGMTPTIFVKANF